MSLARALVTKRYAHVKFTSIARGRIGALLQEKLCSTPCSVAQPYALKGVLGCKTLSPKRSVGFQNLKP